MPDGPAPAWSDGQAIYINQEEITEMDLETLTQVTGLNYHELRPSFLYSKQGYRLHEVGNLENDLMQASNILEDQRIETLLVATLSKL
jgi:hypothetical protein